MPYDHSSFKIAGKGLHFTKGTSYGDRVLHTDKAGNSLRKDYAGKFSVTNRDGGTVSGASFKKFIKANPKAKKYFR